LFLFKVKPLRVEGVFLHEASSQWSISLPLTWFWSLLDEGRKKRPKAAGLPSSIIDTCEQKKWPRVPLARFPFRSPGDRRLASVRNKHRTGTRGRRGGTVSHLLPAHIPRSSNRITILGLEVPLNDRSAITRRSRLPPPLLFPLPLFVIILRHLKNKKTRARRGARRSRMASRIRRRDNTRFAFRSRARLAQKARAARAAFSSAYQRKRRLLRNNWMESYARKIYLSKGETPCPRRDSARERNGGTFGRGEGWSRDFFFARRLLTSAKTNTLSEMKPERKDAREMKPEGKSREMYPISWLSNLSNSRSRLQLNSWKIVDSRRLSEHEHDSILIDVTRERLHLRCDSREDYVTRFLFTQRSPRVSR